MDLFSPLFFSLCEQICWCLNAQSSHLDCVSHQCLCRQLQAKHLSTRNFTKTQSCAIAELASLVLLNLSRCGICDEGCENLEGKHDVLLNLDGFLVFLVWINGQT
jgi:hypothetical protein